MNLTGLQEKGVSTSSWTASKITFSYLQEKGVPVYQL